MSVAAMEPGTGWGGVVMANGEARRPLFHINGMSRGRGGHGPKRREGGEQSAGMLTVWRWGGCGMQSFGAVTLCIDVQDGRGG